MSRYWKTIIAALTFAVVAVQAFVTDPVFQDVILDSKVTQQEAFSLLILAIGVLGVYAKANTPPAGQPSDPDISETAPR